MLRRTAEAEVRAWVREGEDQVESQRTMMGDMLVGWTFRMLRRTWGREVRGRFRWRVLRVGERDAQMQVEVWGRGRGKRVVGLRGEVQKTTGGI